MSITLGWINFENIWVPRFCFCLHISWSHNVWFWFKYFYIIYLNLTLIRFSFYSSIIGQPERLQEINWSLQPRQRVRRRHRRAREEQSLYRRLVNGQHHRSAAVAVSHRATDRINALKYCTQTEINITIANKSNNIYHTVCINYKDFVYNHNASCRLVIKKKKNLYNK